MNTNEASEFVDSLLQYQGQHLVDLVEKWKDEREHVDFWYRNIEWYLRLFHDAVYSEVVRLFPFDECGNQRYIYLYWIKNGSRNDNYTWEFSFDVENVRFKISIHPDGEIDAAWTHGENTVELFGIRRFCRPNHRPPLGLNHHLDESYAQKLIKENERKEQ